MWITTIDKTEYPILKTKQIKEIVQTTLLAAKDQMQTLENSPYKSFNVFGYDFMIDTDMKVHLIEINSSPAVAAELLPEFTQALVEKAIDPVFPVLPKSTQDLSLEEKGETSEVESQTAFELVC